MRVCTTNTRWISTKEEGWLNFLVRFSLGVRKMTGKVELWLVSMVASQQQGCESESAIILCGLCVFCLSLLGVSLGTPADVSSHRPK